MTRERYLLLLARLCNLQSDLDESGELDDLHALNACKKELQDEDQRLRDCVSGLESALDYGY